MYRYAVSPARMVTLSVTGRRWRTPNEIQRRLWGGLVAFRQPFVETREAAVLLGKSAATKILSKLADAGV